MIFVMCVCEKNTYTCTSVSEKVQMYIAVLNDFVDILDSLNAF